MARQTRPLTPPNTATPGDQALVTPANRPDVLLAIQHTQAVQTLHQECANIRQDLGTIRAEVAALKVSKTALENDIQELKHLRSKIIGGLIVLGLFGATLGGII